MDNYQFSYIDHSLIQKMQAFRNTKEALLAYFQAAELPPYSVKGDGGQFQLYHRLKKTQLRIQQCLFIDETNIICRTTIAEISLRNSRQAKTLPPLIAKINREIEYGQFKIDIQGTGDIHFLDRFSPEELFTEETTFYYFENIERLIGYPHFLIDQEYGTAFLQIIEDT